MTEESEKKPSTGATTGGIPGVKPPTADQLPEEERWQVTGENPPNSNTGGLYGDFTEARAEQQEGGRVFDETENAVEWFQKKTTEGFRFWAQFTEYRIKMDDGRTERFRRVPITKYQSDELLDISAEIQGARSLDDKPLNQVELRQRGKLLDQLKAQYYLRNLKTGKPMSVEELKHVADGTIIDSILEACFAITVAKWAEGKK